MGHKEHRGKLSYMILMCSLLLVYGCEKSDAVNKPGDQGTAVYISGGAGLDFGRKPIKDVSLTTEAGNKYRVVVYKLPEAIEDVDSAIGSILTEDGYERSVQKSDRSDFDVLYRKGSNYPVLFRYKSTVDPGLERSTVLTLWWHTEIINPSK